MDGPVGHVKRSATQSLAGALWRIGHLLRPSERRATKQARASLATLVRCAAMVANADGRLDARELDTIRTVVRKLTGAEVAEEEIREIVKKVGFGGADPVRFVARSGARVDRDTRVLIAKACYTVMVSDGEISDRERETLDGILDGLELQRETVVELGIPL